MTKKLNKILIIIPILIAFFMQIMLLRPRIVHAAMPMTLAADMYIGWACSDGATYPVYSADITDGKGNIASYVGCSVNTMKVSEEGAALKFNLASIHGNITSAVLKIFVS